MHAKTENDKADCTKRSFVQQKLVNVKVLEMYFYTSHSDRALLF